MLDHRRVTLFAWYSCWFLRCFLKGLHFFILRFHVFPLLDCWMLRFSMQWLAPMSTSHRKFKSYARSQEVTPKVMFLTLDHRNSVACELDRNAAHKG